TTGNAFAALAQGGYVGTNPGYGGMFNVISQSGYSAWFNLPTLNGVATNPGAITALNDGGFVFSYANSDQLDRYNATGVVHSTLHLGSIPVGAVAEATFSDGVMETAWVANGQLSVRAFNTMGTATTAALSAGAAADGANSQVNLLATGVHDQSVAFWTSGG